ncbi:T9SS type A sorting domain-containing protein [Pedobacter sp. PWIIR3]
MSIKPIITLLLKIICLAGICILSSVVVFAQKPDSSINSIRSKKMVNTPLIKGSVPTYKPKYNFGFIPYTEIISASKTTSTGIAAKNDKLLSVLKVYPNPVDDEVNVMVRIDREASFSVKIMDLLGNEVVTLANERIGAGEQTKTYNIPDRLNTGIYFLKIVAGAETVVKRISVL